MSDHSTSAAENRLRASDWLAERRISENWSADDQARLDAWLAESLAHRVAYVRLDAAWRRTERLAALRCSEPAEEPSAPRGRMLHRLAAMAMSLLVLATIGSAAALYLSRPAEKTYATVLGGHRAIALADGSHVELNTDTALRAAVNTRYRTVWLDRGEAYFQIAHDTGHPFVVMAGDRRVTVLGTKFFVRRDAGKLEVAVVEGRVRLDADDAPAGARSATLTPGDLVIATANAALIKEKAAQKLASALGWRHGMLVFDHTTLADAAAEFNRYNRRKLIVADSVASRLTVDGTFPTTNAEAFIDVAQEVFGLRIEKRSDETVISR